MKLIIPQKIMDQIHDHGEASYPEEGAGLMMGSEEEGTREVFSILPLSNAREENARHHRYLITAEDMLHGEDVARERGQTIVGIFHSHPDHPDRPSDYDREWAIPWYSYLITSIRQGQADGSRSWRLAEDRSGFIEETLEVQSTNQAR